MRRSFPILALLVALTAPLLPATVPVVTLTPTDATAAEPGLDTGLLTIALSTPAATPLSVVLVRTGTAADGVDCSAVPASVVVPVGATSALVPILPLDDAIAETAETVTVSLAAGSGYTLGTATTATVVIADDEPLTLSLTASDNQASEPAAGMGGGVFTIARTGVAGPALTIPIAVSGSASSGRDYTALAGTLAFPAGATSATIAVTALDDTATEADESVTATLQPGAGYALGTASATVMVLDDEPPVLSVSLADSSASEPGTDTGRFQINRTGRRSTALTVAYTVGGTATPGSDYVALPASLALPANAANASLTVSPLDDLLVDENETVALTLATGTGYQIGSAAAATLLIRDDEWGIAIAASDAVAFEPASDTGTFLVTRSGPGSTAAALTIPYTVGGTAIGGTDYVALSGSVTIPATKTSATITVGPRDDTLLEGVETVVVTLGAVSGSVLRVASATVAIGDDERANPTISVSVPDAAAAEAGADAGRFTIARSGPTTTAQTVAYTMGGTAGNGGDYAALPGTVVIPAGASSIDLAITPRQDTGSELTETVVLTIAPAADHLLGAVRSGTVTIADDDAATVSIGTGDSTASEPAGGSGTGQFTITRTGALGAALTVNLATGGTATPGTDHQPLPGTVTIAAGAASAAVMVVPLDDAVVEPVETVVASLVAGAGYALKGATSATVSLDDDETPVVTVSASAPANENGSPKGTLTVQREGSRVAALTVPLTVSGSATAGADYTAPGTTVTIAAGSSSKAVTVAPIQDTLIEGDEAVVATIAGGSGYALGGTTSATLILLDDEPGVRIAALDAEATGPDDLGLITIRRSGSLASPLALNLTVGGTAVPGTHYLALPTSITIPANGTGAVLAIRPLTTVTTITAVTVGIAPAAAYAVNPPTTATVTLRPANGNTPPTISVIADRTVAEDGTVGPIAVTIGDAQTAAGSLGFSASASSGTLLPSSRIITGGTGADRTLTLRPATNRSGTTTVTVAVSDGILTTTRSFTLTVTAVNDPPVNTALPVIAGSAIVGQPLTVGTGTWNDSADGGTIARHAWQWQRADATSGAGLADIPGATAAGYVPVLADLGRVLRVRVTATDAGTPTPAASTVVSTAWTTPVAPGTVATPVLTLIDGVTTGAAPVVRATTTTPGATLRYTLDGSDPTLASAVLDPAGIALAVGTTTVRVRGWCDGYTASAVAAGSWTVGGALAAPTLTPPSPGSVPPPWPAGTPILYGPVGVTLSAAPGAVIRYTLDGSQPGPASPLYSTPIPLDGGVTTVTARAFSALSLPSASASVTYWFNCGNAEFVPRNQNVFPWPYSVQAECAETPGAILNYEIDRTMTLAPYATPASPVWPAGGYPCEVGRYRINVRAYKPGYFGGGGSTMDFWIRLPPPVVTQPPGLVYNPMDGHWRTYTPVTVSLAPPPMAPSYAPPVAMRWQPTHVSAPWVEYTGPITLDGPTATSGGRAGFQARAYLHFQGDEQLVEPAWRHFDFHVAPPAWTITASTGGNRISATSITPGAEFRYTTDGSDPTPTSPLLPATIPGTVPQIRVRGFRGSYIPTATVTVDNVPTGLGGPLPAAPRRAG